jgi:predicted nucleic acid-binding protein
VSDDQRLTFVDTNILVYAHDRGSERHNKIARGILGALWETGSGVLSTQVLQEFYAVVTRKLKRPMEKVVARRLVADYGEWCSVDTDPLLIVSASRLEEEHSLAFWDALVIEAALRAGAGVLLSEDLQDGRRFADLVIRNPFREG